MIAVGPAAQRGGEQLGAVDAERGHDHRAGDRAGDRQAPHRPAAEQHHRHGEERAGDHADGPDAAPTPGVGEPAADRPGRSPPGVLVRMAEDA